jgi:hypothetical protein
MIVVVESVVPAATNSADATSISSTAVEINLTMQFFADMQQICNTRPNHSELQSFS